LLLHFDIMITLMWHPVSYTSIIRNNVNHPHINYSETQHFTAFDNAMKQETHFVIYE
jgi:hypothetical protein